ncbi:MAG: glycine cleavage T C-terminal barrel domain-containing protein, partial [Alphaproteobacteria bacterium]
RMPEMENFYVACGFPAGIAASGGVAQAMANWILHGDPGMDLWQFDARRFGPHHANNAALGASAVVAYSRYYQIHWPGEELIVARKLRHSPLHEILAQAGACFGAKFGWERPNWFAGPGDDTREVPSFEGKPSWFDAVGREVLAVRQKVALIDQTSFAKFEVTGPHARDALQQLAVADLAGPPGRCIYTQMCNPAGGIEADLTIMHIDDQRFYIVTGSGFGVRDAGWIARHLPDDGSVQINDVTNQWAVINLCGPRARDVLAAVTDADVSNAAFPFLEFREIEVDCANVRAARIGYVGELGWELHIPVEWGLHVYRALWRAGQAHGIANVGYRAIDSLRLEKGYLYWSADISPDYTPFEAGLGFCVDLHAGDFIGCAALMRAKEIGPQRKLCSFTTSGFAPFLGGEAILHDGAVVGLTTSAGFGHALGKTISLGYLPVDLTGETTFQIEAFGKAYDALRGPRTLYDPERAMLNS